MYLKSASNVFNGFDFFPDDNFSHVGEVGSDGPGQGPKAPPWGPSAMAYQRCPRGSRVLSNAGVAPAAVACHARARMTDTAAPVLGVVPVAALAWASPPASEPCWPAGPQMLFSPPPPPHTPICAHLPPPRAFFF